MIADLKPYAEYKESGLPWLGQVPSTWRVVRNGSLFGQRNQTGYEELPILEVSLKTGVRVRDFENSTRKQVMSDVGKYKRAAKGDVAYNMMRMWQGAVGVSPVDGLVSPAYVVARPYPQVESRFFVALFRTGDYMSEIDNCSRGIVKDRNRLYWNQFKQILSPCPPPAEQAAIVRFLDWANGRLERAIRAKKKELALASEVLLTVTQQSLRLQGTRSLHLSTVVEVTSRPIDRRAGRSYTPIGLYNRGRGIFHKATTDGAELGDSDFFWVEDGDLVISGQFAWEGAVALARAKDSGCVASHRYPILRGRVENASSAVLLALFRTSYGSMLLDHYSRGAAGRNRPLNVGMLLKEKVPIPPLPAQARIAELLDQEFAVAQSLAQTIRFINEYRTRLVADVVTGKLDVREAAARLSEEAAPDTAEDDADRSVDPDTADEEAAV
jgi:type I restriction enzyme, S subunit